MSARSVAGRLSLFVLAGLVALGVAIERAEARPTYFDQFTTFYGFTSGDDLYACGVCHFRWTGTGARNPYGTAVEQQLYLGKPIQQAIEDVEGVDSDSDGFTNVDEIMNFLTLPGYSCSNFFDAVGAPQDFHTYITPMVASCLEPHDIRVAPGAGNFLTEVGDVDVLTFQVFNNGSDVPLMIDAYEMAAGSHTFYSVAGPAAPLSIPIGGSILLDVTFAPTASAFANGTLRITSDDPDEGIVDLAITGLSFEVVLANPEQRATCLGDVLKEFRTYNRKHLREWDRCYFDEVRGRACDTGRRDLKIQQAAAKLRSRIGEKDRRCDRAGLNPSLLGFGTTCGVGCGAISLTSVSRLADCLVCRQEEATALSLTAALGTAPPDLPPNQAGSKAAERCQKRLLRATEKAVAKGMKQLGKCELENITAAAAVDCAAEHAGKLAAIAASLDGQIDRCKDTGGLLGCLFEPGPDLTCLGTAATSIASDLIDAAMALED